MVSGRTSIGVQWHHTGLPFLHSAISLHFLPFLHSALMCGGQSPGTGGASLKERRIHCCWSLALIMHLRGFTTAALVRHSRSDFLTTPVRGKHTLIYDNSLCVFISRWEKEKDDCKGLLSNHGRDGNPPSMEKPHASKVDLASQLSLWGIHTAGLNRSHGGVAPSFNKRLGIDVISHSKFYFSTESYHDKHQWRR